MNRLIRVFLAVLILALTTNLVQADETSITKEGPYLVISGNVTNVTARMLTINSQSYPVSMFVRVFSSAENGREIPMQTIANIGKIDLAKIYILGGKVEKIVVQRNL